MNLNEQLQQAYEAGRRQAGASFPETLVEWDYSLGPHPDRRPDPVFPGDISNPASTSDINQLLDFVAWLVSNGLIEAGDVSLIVQGIMSGYITVENLNDGTMGDYWEWLVNPMLWNKWRYIQQEQDRQPEISNSQSNSPDNIASTRPTQGINHGGYSPQLREAYESGRRQGLNESDPPPSRYNGQWVNYAVTHWGEYSPPGLGQGIIDVEYLMNGLGKWGEYISYPAPPPPPPPPGG
jgi:hypothetical protein